MVERLEDRLAPALVSWTGGAGTLLWRDAANWDAGVQPAAGDDAVIGSGFAGAVVTSDSPVTIQSLTSAAGLRLVGGAFEAATVQSSADVTLAGGTLQGATVTLTGGAALVGKSGLLDGVAVAGDLDLSRANSEVSVRNGLVLNGTARLGNAIGSTSGGLDFEGTQTLGGTGTVVFGKSPGNFLHAVNNVGPDPALVVLTIAPGVTVRGSAGRIGNVIFGYPSTVVNEGTITADDSGGVTGFDYDNGYLGGVTDNTGAAVIDTSGVTDPAPQAVYQTSRYAAHYLSYVLADLTPGASYLVRLHFSEAGVQIAPGDRRFHVDANGVRVLTDFDIVAAAGGANRAVVREFTATADGLGRVTLELVHGDSPDVIVNINAIELRSGAVVVRTVDAGLLAGGAVTIDPGVFHNHGTAQAGGTGTLTLGGSWDNTGTLGVSGGGTLNLGGTFTTAAVGTLTRTGGTVKVTGTLDNRGATLALGTGTGVWNLFGGTILGGHYTAGGSGRLVFTSAGGTLDGLTADADLDLATVNDAYARVVNGLTLNATARLGNAAGSTNSRVEFDGTQTLGGTGTVVFGKSQYNFFGPANNAGPNPALCVLTIGSGITVRGSTVRIGSYNSLTYQATVVSAGTIVADDSGGATGFDYDAGYSGGSTDNTGAAVIDTTGVTDPAPQAVYQTSRYATGELSYSLAGLTAGASYLIRLHFSEAGTQVAPGDRRFDIEANGVRMVADFDVVAAAGGANRAVVREFTATADGTGRIVLRLVHANSPDAVVILNGIELRSGGTVVRTVDAGLLAGGVLTIDPAVFRNEGSITVHPAVPLTLGGDWTNDGTITGLAGATIYLGGTFTPADLGTMNVTNATVAIIGTVENAGATLALTAATGSWNLDYGVIRGGTVATSGGARLISRGYGGTLDGVTVTGDLDLTGSGAQLFVVNGLTLNGTARVGSATGTTSGGLAFVGTQTLAGTGAVVFGKSPNNVLRATDVLTIGAGMTLRGGGVTIGDGFGAGTIINRGTIAADASGVSFGYDRGFLPDYNTGTTTEHIDTTGVPNAAPEEVYQTARGFPPFGYTLRDLVPNAAYTLRLHFAEFELSAVGQRVFDVRVNGVLALANYDVIAAAGGRLKAVVEELAATADANGQVALTFEGVNGAGPFVSGIEVVSGSVRVQSIDSGLLPGGTFTISPTVFRNEGTITVVPAEVLTLGGDWTNAGTLAAVPGATLNLGGTFTLADLGPLPVAGVTVNVTGLLDNTTTTLALDATTGPWNLVGGTILGGTVATAGPAELRGTGGLDGVTVRGDLVPDGTITVTHGLTLHGTASLAEGDVLAFADTATFSGTGTVVFGGGASNRVQPAVGTTLTIGAGVTLRGANGFVGNAGATTVNAGTIAADVTGAINLFGAVRNEGTFRIGDGAMLYSDVALSFAGLGRLDEAAGGTFLVQSDWLGGTTNAAGFRAAGTVRLIGAGTSVAPQRLEAMSRDLGNVPAGFAANFAFGTLAVAAGTYVLIVDLNRNTMATTPEAVYVDSLVVAAGATLDLNGLRLYARTSQVDGAVVGGSVRQLADSGPLAFGTPTPGVIAVPGERDEWTFFGRTGHAVGVLVDPTGLGFVEVALLNAAGTVLAVADNAAGGGVVSLDGVALPADGTYRVRVRAATGHSSATGNYVITAHDVTPDVRPLALEQTVAGYIEHPFAVDRWTFTAAAGQSVRFDLVSTSAPGLAFDLTDPFGVPVFTGLTADSGLLTLTSPGVYTLTARGTAGRTGAYAFRVENTSLTDLTLGVPFTGTALGGGQGQMFRVTVTDPKALSVLLADGAATNRHELYARLGSPPTRETYDFRSSHPGEADQDLLVPRAAAGVWYVLVFTETAPAGSPFTLTAATADVVLTNAMLTRLGAAGDATLTLDGAGFRQGMAVALVGANNVAYPVSNVTFDSATHLTARVSLAALPDGPYTVRVTDPIVALVHIALIPPLNIISDVTGAANFEVRLSLPGSVRRNSTSTFYLEYTNTGSVAMPAPVLVVDSGDADGSDRPWLTLDAARLPQEFWTGQSWSPTSAETPDGLSHVVQVLASGRTPGVLQPGETMRVPVYYAGLRQLWDFADMALEIRVRTLTADDTTAVDWPAMKADLRPTDVSPLAWDAIFANLTGQLGGTWGDYVRTLGDSAAYLGRLGIAVADVGQLWGFAVQQANGLSPLGPTAAVTDIAVPTPGLSLSFGRVFVDTHTARNAIGPLGIGWATSWETRLTRDSDNVVTIAGAGGARREFQPDPRTGGYYGAAGDHGTLTAGTGGTFTLREPDGSVTAFRADGRLNFVADANGNRITTGYGAAGLVSLTHSAGMSLTLTYTGDGLVDRITASDGRFVQYAYGAVELAGTGAARHLTAATGTDGQTTGYTYAAAFVSPIDRGLASIAFPGGTHEFLTYDGRGRLASVGLDGGAERVTLTYDAAGGVTLTDAAGKSSRLFFDHRGLLVKVENALGNAVLSTFDDEFNLTSVTDAAGATRTFQYDDRGNVVAETDALGNRVSYTYGGPFDRLTSVDTGRGGVTSYAYDAAGNLSATTYANNTVERVAYDALGNPLSFTNRRGQATAYTYNAAGQVLTESFADGTHTTFTYDAHGNLRSATDADGTTTFDYDAADRLEAVTYPTGRSLEYAYDAAGRRTRMETRDTPTATPHVLTYAYDAAGRLRSLSDGSGPIVTYTYDAVGRLQRKDMGNGTFTTFDYDAAGQLLHLVNHAPGGAVNSRFDYTYTAVGLTSTMATLDGTWTYSYDATGQLTHAVFASINPGVPSQNLTYRYDALGNRTQTIENGAVTDYVANNLNQYTSVGGATYSYDLDGNLIAITGSAADATYDYDTRNQLVRVTTSAGVWEYEYDEFGARTATVHNGQRTEYLLDPTGLVDVVGEYDGAGNLINRYTHGNGLTSQIHVGGSASYYDFDAVGSTVGLTGATGLVENSYTYRPFGERVTAAEAVANPFGFVGQYGVMNEGNGLSFMRARYYQVGTGRFLNVDPLGLNGGEKNLYGYVGNNPGGAIDSQGTFAVPLVAAATVVGGVAGGLGYMLTHPNDFQTRGLIAAVAGGAVGGLVSGLTTRLGSRSSILAGAAGSATEYLVNNVGTPTFSWRQLAKETGSGAGIGFGVSRIRPLVNGWGRGGPGFLRTVLGDNLHGVQLWRDSLIGEAVNREFGPDVGNIIEGIISIFVPRDPNALTGPAGFGPERFVAPDALLPYRIDFENDANATAAAQAITISDPLDASLDADTFELTEVVFADTVLTVPAGSRHFQTTVPVVVDGEAFDVLIEAGIDSATRTVFARFQSIDPDTALPPNLAGFLQPENGTGRGQGHVSYVVRPHAGLPTGTVIRNVALITFDGAETIATNQIDPHDPTKGTDPAKEAFNTIDAGTPTSGVAALPAVSTAANFTVTWAGADDAGGSGVASYTVFVSDNGGPFVPFLTDTPLTSALFPGQDGHTYAFFTVAADGVGHHEAAPATADATTTVSVPPSPPATPAPVLVGFREFAVGAGGGPVVRSFNPDGSPRSAGPALDGAATGGVRTAAADFTGDGVADVVVGTGPGSATLVRVLDGVTGAELFRVAPFEAAFVGGVYVAAGDLTGDGVPDLVVTPDEGGGPRVQVYSGAGFAKVADFFGIDDANFRGGARAAVGDLNGDGVGDLVVAAGFGGGPRVAAFDGKSVGGALAKLFNDFFLFEPALRNGAFVAVGDLDGDGFADLIGGGGPGGGPRVLAFSGRDLLAGTADGSQVLANFFAGNVANRGGIRVAVKDLDGDTKADLVVGDGMGAGSRVTGYLGKDFGGGGALEAFGFDTFPGLTTGVFVG